MRKFLALGAALWVCSLAALADYPEASETLDSTLVVQRGFLQTYSGEQELYFGVAEDMLDMPFLIATTVNSGGAVTGFQWTDYLCSFEKIGDHIALIEKNTRFTGEGELADAIARTYTNRVLFAFPIAAYDSATAAYVVDAKSLFADNPQVLFGDGFFFDSSLAKLNLKSFADNLEVLYTMPAAGSGEFMSLHYSLSSLPENDYEPRFADPRVGYFLTAYKDLAKGDPDQGQFVRMINRWDLRKADPTLELSPPVEPIIFYIEKTVPVRFRRAVAEGILEWNKAFEAIGFSGAIEVRQQTDYNEFRDLDPADVNYNFFRWITSGDGFAMGPSRVNPLTGQIIDADIVFDDSMARFYESEGEVYTGDTWRHPQWKGFVESLHARHPLREILPREREVTIGGNRVALPDNPRICCLGQGRSHQLGFAKILMGDDVNWASFGQAAVKDTVMHEVGHTLGLRHNFKASTWLSLDEINSAERPAAIAGSVMDYLPINLSVDKEKQGAYVMETIGPYDFWVIEYGYKVIEEPGELLPILQRVAEPALIYGTDEDTSTPDPHAMRWDLGSNQVDYAKSRMQLATARWNLVADKLVKEGESFTKARQRFQRLLGEYRFAATLCGGYLGGSYLVRDFKGDPNGRTPVTPVDAERQRQALELLCRVLSGQDFQFTPEVLRHLAAGRWYHWGSNDPMADATYPVRQAVLAVQLNAYYSAVNPFTFTEMLDQQYMTKEAKPVTVGEVLGSVVKTVFGEYGQGRAPVNDFRRHLQRSIADDLIYVANEGSWGWYPAEARFAARAELETLHKAMTADLGAGTEDAATLAHRRELSDRIGRALKAQFVAPE
jgi:hypothetical protein